VASTDRRETESGIGEVGRTGVAIDSLADNRAMT
jgi:hypothetical protein